MSHPRASAIAFLSLTGLLVLAAAAALAASVPYAQAAARAQSAKLVGESATAKPAATLANYQLAVWLDPANEKARLSLAAAQIRSGQAEAALATLQPAGQGSAAADLRLRANIELRRTDAAAGLTQMLASQTSPEAAQRIARAQAGKLPLAAELYAEGLPESSSAILVQLPVSFERNLLLGRINYDHHTASSLKAAAEYLKVAVQLKPSDLPARRLYATTLTDLGETSAATHQTQLVRHLETQRP